MMWSWSIWHGSTPGGDPPTVPLRLDGYPQFFSHANHKLEVLIARFHFSTFCRETSTPPKSWTTFSQAMRA